MSLISGILSFDRTVEDLTGLSRLLVSAETPEGASGSSQQEGLFLSTHYSAKFGKKAEIFESGAGVLHVYGEIFLPSGVPVASLSAAEELRHELSQKGGAYLRECTGAFILVYYDARQRSLNIFTDSFGNFAMHYALNGNTLFFSTKVEVVSKLLGDASINNESVLEYIGFGHPLGGKTYYKNVNRVPPSTHLAFSRNGLKTEKYFQPSCKKIPASEYSGVLSQIKQLVLRNVDAQTESPGTEAALSGGYDSRITAGALSYLGKKQIPFYTHGKANSNDIAIAKQIATTLGNPHRVLIFDDDFFSSLGPHFQEVIARTNGSLGAESSPIFAEWLLAPKEIGSILDSHGGPLFRRQILKSQSYSSRRYRHFGEFIFEKMHSPLLDTDFLSKEIGNEAQEAAKRSLRYFFDALPSELEAGDKIDLFYVNELCANRFSSASNEQIRHVGLAHPLLSPAIGELLLSFPSAYRTTNSVYKYLLHSFAPQMERIPLDNSGFKVPYGGYRFLRYLPQGIERVLQKTGVQKKYSLRKPIYSSDDIVRHNLPPIKDILLSNDVRTNVYFHNDSIERLLKNTSENDGSFPRHLLPLVSAKLLIGSL